MKKKPIPTKIYLTEDEMPKSWYNLRADMKEKHEPFLNPATLKEVTAEDLGHIFCDELVKQELDQTTRYIEIPEGIRDFYKMFRPSPLVRAYWLEKELDNIKSEYSKKIDELKTTKNKHTEKAEEETYNNIVEESDYGEEDMTAIDGESISEDEAQDEIPEKDDKQEEENNVQDN